MDDFMDMMPTMIKQQFLEKEVFIADSLVQEEFIRGKHKKYDAQFYFQDASLTEGKLVPMSEPRRSEVGKRAYTDFVESLRELGQMEPLDSQSTGEGCDVAGAGELACGVKNAKELFKLATLERMLSDRKAAKTQSMFRKRLLARSRGFSAQGTEQDPLLNPEIGRPALRQATADMLLAPPEQDFNVGLAITNGISALAYFWTLCSQASADGNLHSSLSSFMPLMDSCQGDRYTLLTDTADGIMYSSEGRLVRNSWLDLTTLDTLWTIFVLKEAFFISLPLMALLVAGLLLCLGAVLAPVAGVAWFGYFNTDPRRARLAKNTVEKAIIPALKRQILIIISLPLSVSTTWRIICLVQQILARKTNKSAKDFEAALTMVSNMMYSLSLLMVEGGGKIGLVPSLCMSTFSLLRMLTQHTVLLSNVCDGLKDINENKLSKFELALLITKISDVMLDDDIQYNFVEHLYTSHHTPLKPDTGHLDEDAGDAGDDDLTHFPKDLLETADKAGLAVIKGVLQPKPPSSKSGMEGNTFPVEAKKDL